MAYQLKDRVVFITGASGGIGRACAVEYHRAGCRVVATARSYDKLVELSRELGEDRVFPIQLDVTDAAQREARKNYVNSEITAPKDIGSDVEDLHGLVQTLGLGRFHAVGVAAGGGIVMQYSVTHPKKLLSMTIACSLGSVKDKEYYKASAALRPETFYKLSVEVRELGPCYRAANPKGVRHWVELQKNSRPNRRFLAGPQCRAEVTWTKLKSEKIPTLLLGGDADLYMPPPMLKYFHDRMPGSEMVIIQGSGHSAYWEQPETFNRTVADFLSRHSN